jgi:hypothetical protein
MSVTFGSSAGCQDDRTTRVSQLSDPQKVPSKTSTQSITAFVPRQRLFEQGKLSGKMPWWSEEGDVWQGYATGRFGFQDKLMPGRFRLG